MTKINISVILCIFSILLFPRIGTAQVTTPGQLTFYIRLDDTTKKPVISQKIKEKYTTPLSTEDLRTKVQITTGLIFTNSLPNGYAIEIKSDNGKILNGSNNQYILSTPDDIKFFTIKITFKKKDTVFDNVGKDFKSKIAPPVDIPPVKETVTAKPVYTNKHKVIETEKSELYDQVQKIVEKKYKYIGSQSNIVIDDKGVIQIFLDEDCKPIYTGFPTTARSNYDKFQFHIITKKKHNYTFSTDCNFQEIKISNEIENNPLSGDIVDNAPYVDIQSATFGPCSDIFPFKIEKDGVQVIDWEVKLLKTTRVSLGTSVIASWLNNPENISTFTLANGTQTLIADNPDTRAYLGLFLTFHFVPRNINIQPRTGWERLGMSVGTNLNDKAFQNFFLGLNFEITNGLFLNGGLHYGQVNYVIGHDDFNFGEDSFSGTLEIREKWKIGGPYLSVNIDAELFAKVFKNILSPTTATVTP